ncbi:MAG: phosphatidylserine decarboxylase family protein, partial [Chitinophagaceae bacterium]
MTIHKEGYATIAWSVIVFAVINLLSFYFLSFEEPVITGIIFVVTLGLVLFIVSFFRIPKRELTNGDTAIVAPADGKVV